jgi:hypothetical protein
VSKFDRDDFGDWLTGWSLLILVVFVLAQVIRRLL